MIKRVGFIANTPQSAVQAVLDALYCIDKLGPAINEFHLIYVAALEQSGTGIIALPEHHLAQLHALGIDIGELAKTCHGRFHYADHVSISEHEKSWCSMSVLGVVVQGVDFHHLLSKAIAENNSIDKTLAPYSLNNSCQASNKHAMPVADKRDIRSSLQTSLYVNANELFAMLKTFLASSKTKIELLPVDELTNFYMSPADPRYSLSDDTTLNAVGKDSYRADFFFDYRCEAVFQQFSVDQASPIAAGIYIKDGHLMKMKSSANRHEIVAIENSNASLQDSMSKAGFTHCKAIEQPSTRRQQAGSFWHGNVINISALTNIACVAVSVPVDINMLILDQWIDNMPSENTMGIVRKLANQQFSQFNINLTCFALLPLFVTHPQHPLFINGQDEPLDLIRRKTNEMTNRLALFKKGGTQYVSDADPIPRHLWTNLLLALNVWPQQFDIVATTLPDSVAIIEKLARQIKHATEQLPSYPQ